jgi:spermidine/putrescine transport system ATP-binding protein
MNHGLIEQLGSPEALYERPQTRFVAGFIGTTNLLSGTIDGLDGETAIVLLSSGERCTMAADGLASGTPVELSVRPEAIRICPVDPGDPSPGRQIRGIVEQSAYLGNFVTYQVATDGGLSLSALAPRSEQRAAVGSPVTLEWAAADSLVVAETRAGHQAEEEV